MFYLTKFTDVCNFSDDATFFVSDGDLKHIMERPENYSKMAAEWFKNNYMKLNKDKCHLLVAGHRYETLWAKIGVTRIWKVRAQNYLD